MNAQQSSGIVLLVVGIGLAIFGMTTSQSAADQVSKFFTGHFTDATAWYVIGGMVTAVAGVLMISFGRRTASA